MSKQKSSTENERPSIYDRWDAEAWEGCSYTAGCKRHLQEYPCITGHTKDYALIAFSDDEGKIVDTEGRTIEEGDPKVLYSTNKTGQRFRPVGDVNSPPVKKTEYLFWKERYPELLTW